MAGRPSRLRPPSAGRQPVASTPRTSGSICPCGPAPGASRRKTQQSIRAPQQQRPKEEFSLPAFSTIAPGEKSKKVETELDKLRKKTIRRNAPPGEDLNEIKNILKGCKKNKVTVQEFVGLIAPYTGDNGVALREVMNEDLATFYRLARKVYETMTQDSSDVLLNQQLQLSDHYRESEALIYYKLNKAIDGIYAMAPNFQFHKFVQLGDEYLKTLFPIPREIKLEPEELDLMKRQRAYHRLQWLKSEGDRLREENTKLQKKLHELKKHYKQDQMQALHREEEAEKQHQVLENAESKAEHILTKLNESIEKSMVEKETSIRIEADQEVLKPREDDGKPKDGGEKRKVRKPDWRVEAAREIDSLAIEQVTVSEIKKARMKAKQQGQKDPFHYSPIKTPPPKQQQQQGEKSPFHYSPPPPPPQPQEESSMQQTRRSPKQDCLCPDAADPLQVQSFREQSRTQTQERPQATTSARHEVTETTVVEEIPPQNRRRCPGPKDSWGGFN